MAKNSASVSLARTPELLPTEVLLTRTGYTRYPPSAPRGRGPRALRQLPVVRSARRESTYVDEANSPEIVDL